MGFLLPLCRKQYGLSISACCHVSHNLLNVEAEVKGQGHSKNGLLKKNLCAPSFGSISCAIFKFGMSLDPAGTNILSFVKFILTHMTMIFPFVP